MMWTVQTRTLLKGIIFEMLNQISVCLLHAVCHPGGCLLVLYIVCQDNFAEHFQSHQTMGLYSFWSVNLFTVRKFYSKVTVMQVVSSLNHQ